MLLAGCTQKEKAGVSPLHVEGTQLVNEAGEPVVLRGVSFGWHNLWPRFYNAGAVKTFHKKWGVNIFRASIGVDDLHETGDNLGYVSDPETAMDCLYSVIDAAIENDSYVIVDWHSHRMHPDEETGADKAAEFFSEVVTRYRNVPNVIYELYNEPIMDSIPQIFNYCESLCNLIGTMSDVKPVILMGSPHWDQDIHLIADAVEAGFEPTYPNLMWTMHFYAATHKEYLRECCQHALDKGLPLFFSECGGCEASGNGNLDEESWNEWSEWAEQRGITMLTWNVGDKNETSAMFTPEAKSEGPWPDKVITPWGKFVKEWITK